MRENGNRITLYAHAQLDFFRLGWTRYRMARPRGWMQF
jgi:hypothetical protein